MLVGAEAGGFINGVFADVLDTVTAKLLSASDLSVPYFSSSAVVVAYSKFFFVIAPGPALYTYVLDGSVGKIAASTAPPILLRQAKYAPGLAFTAYGGYLYTASAGGIQGFHIDATTGAAAELAGSPFPSGQPSTMTVDPSGQFLYATDYTGTGQLDAYAIAPNGALSPLATSPYTLPNQSGAASVGASFLAATAHAVYVSMATTGGIAAYTRTTSSGALTPMAGSPFAAGSNTLSLAHAGNFLYATDPNDFRLYGFRIDPSTGSLAPLSGYPIPQWNPSLINTDPEGPASTRKPDRFSGQPRHRSNDRRTRASQFFPKDSTALFG